MVRLTSRAAELALQLVNLIIAQSVRRLGYLAERPSERGLEWVVPAGIPLIQFLGLSVDLQSEAAWEDGALGARVDPRVRVQSLLARHQRNFARRGSSHRLHVAEIFVLV
jgi:hypothetical protein